MYFFYDFVTFYEFSTTKKDKSYTKSLSQANFNILLSAIINKINLFFLFIKKMLAFLHFYKHLLYLCIR